MSDAAMEKLVAEAFEEEQIVVTAEQARFARAWDRVAAALPKSTTITIWPPVPGLDGSWVAGWTVRTETQICWGRGRAKYRRVYGEGPDAVGALEALADALEAMIRRVNVGETP